MDFIFENLDVIITKGDLQKRLNLLISAEYMIAWLDLVYNFSHNSSDLLHEIDKMMSKKFYLLLTESVLRDLNIRCGKYK